ncbi:ATP-binding protein [Novispirillum sp. DQ9]|uniref:ATP-binding protein n=1 Tax=Novispirillum sp. DQ9 TaxID=3398612 RepID=UPI003C7E52A8
MLKGLSAPTRLLAAGVVAVLALAAVMVALATARPWLGVTLAAHGDTVVMTRTAGPAAGLPTPAVLLSVAGIAIGPGDLVEDPGEFETFARTDAFHATQQALSAALAAGPVELRLRLDDGSETTASVSPAPRRPLASLPPVFWFQIAVGTAGFVLSLWVWALRRGDWGARLFALTGASMVGFTFSAAVYSTRELALPADLFRVLSAANTVGALTFGWAMIGVFLSTPRRLVPPAALLVLPAVFGTWTVLGVAAVLPDPVVAFHLSTFVEMVLIVVAILAQWWATRRHPVERAALRWLGLSVTLGAGAFISLNTAPLLLGEEPRMSQGYSFGFFLLIHAGLALGLRRYRLFELGDWAFRVMFTVAALITLIALDAALILALQLGQAVSLGLALLVVGLAWLPLRDVLWRRMVGRRGLPDHELFHAAVAVGLGATPGERTERWRDLLRRLFDPLHLEPAPGPVAAAEARADGLELALPATADSPALVLRYPWAGRGLFGPVHLALAQQLGALVRHVEASRDAYARGAAEERGRIARDLHDDIGARLLSGLHKTDLPGTHATLRDAMADMRTIVRGLSGDRLSLGDVIADVRHEAAQRLEAGGVALDWPLSPAEDAAILLDYRHYKALASTLREIVSNVLRHAGATRVRVETARVDGGLRILVHDDGIGLPAATPEGRGLGNMRRRIGDLGGSTTFPAAEKGTTVEVLLPLPGDTP